MCRGGGDFLCRQMILGLKLLTTHVITMAEKPKIAVAPVDISEALRTVSRTACATQPFTRVIHQSACRQVSLGGGGCFLHRCTLKMWCALACFLHPQWNGAAGVWRCHTISFIQEEPAAPSLGPFTGFNARSVSSSKWDDWDSFHHQPKSAVFL